MFLKSVVLVGLLVSASVIANHNTIGCQQLSGWSHVTTAYLPYLNQPLQAYQPERSMAQCEDNNPTITLVLLKKIVDWHQQHTNGIEINLAQLSLTFNDLNAINFELQFNGQQSDLVTPQEFITKTKNLLSFIQNKNSNNQQKVNQAINQLIDDNAHVEVVFYGENHADIAKPTYYAKFKIKQNINNDVTVKAISVVEQELTYYQSSHYQETPVNFGELKNSLIKGMLITAESKNGKVFRHYYPEDVADYIIEQKNYPIAQELFNEIKVSVGNVKVQHAQ